MSSRRAGYFTVTEYFLTQLSITRWFYIALHTSGTRIEDHTEMHDYLANKPKSRDVAAEVDMFLKADSRVKAVLGM